MAPKLNNALPFCLLLAIVLLARPTNAFGAGNIGSTSKIEGSNWRHGDIEDTLLTLLTARAFGGKKFSKMDVKRVYFGNWLRDYSQAIDVGTVKNVSAEAIRLLLWVLGFMSFGYGTGEFEVTAARLGCYRPEEHIDNPKDYADNIDARQYDRRLRGPVNEEKELSIDHRTGLKHYIATEGIGITTSAEMVRKLLRRCIELGRQYNQTKNKKDFYEALRLLGTACHCLEDYSAHSNYAELALIELGERNVFPHVGLRTQIRIQGARGLVFPIVTGTFGGVDFLHSVLGELSDKTTQSEIQELEGTINQTQRQDNSFLKDLLSKIPSGILGNDDHAAKADELQANAQAQQMQNIHISPKEPEAFTRQADNIARQIYPIMEWHDNLMQNITEAIDKIPVLPELIEQLSDQINVFVFSLIAPFVLPIIKQVKNELSTGSSEIIQSSREKQHIVFNDDSSTDPTHSMLSKDHFSNVLNEPAGKIASQVLKWVVPQIVACWDDPQIDIRRTNDRIIHGVFHHPALREYGDDGARDGRIAMFDIVEQWWREMPDQQRNDLRSQLSREGVEQGRNHKEGVHDSGHGCGKPIGLPTMKTSASSGAIGGPAAAALMGGLGDVLGGSGGGYGYGGSSSNPIGNAIGSAVGGGALGSVVGGLAGAVGGNLLGGAFGDDDSEKQHYKKDSYGRDGSVGQQITETGYRPASCVHEERYGQAQMSHTQYPGGGYREDYQRCEQDGPGGRTGYGFQQTTEVQPAYGGGYDQRTERRFEHPGGRWDSEVQQQHVTPGGQQYIHQEEHHGHRQKSDSDDDSDEGSDDEEKKEKKRRKREQKMRERQEKEEKSRHSGGPPSPDRRRFGGNGPPSPGQHRGRGGGMGGHPGGGMGGHPGGGHPGRGGGMGGHEGGRGRGGGRGGRGGRGDHGFGGEHSTNFLGDDFGASAYSEQGFFEESEYIKQSYGSHERQDGYGGSGYEQHSHERQSYGGQSYGSNYEEQLEKNIADYGQQSQGSNYDQRNEYASRGGGDGIRPEQSYGTGYGELENRDHEQNFSENN